MNSEQKLAWKKFQKAFPDEGHCLEKIVACLNDIGWNFRCVRCSSSALKRTFGARRYFCQVCHYKGWILAGTFFGFVRKSRLWVGVIWLFENGIRINAWQFHRLAGCAYSTALMIFRKMMAVLHENLESKDEVKNTDSAKFCALFWKRSNQTPQGEHPITEQESCGHNIDVLQENESKSEIIMKDISEGISHLTGILSTDQLRILQLVGEKKTHVDEICAKSEMLTLRVLSELTALELDGLLERHPGDYYTVKRNAHKEPPNDVESIFDVSSHQIESFGDFIKAQIHGISRKYLQFYLALFWCMEDRRLWGLNCLLEACCRSSFRSSKTLFQYVTPAQVLMN